MEPENKEFELSGTLGSLNDAALNSLSNPNGETAIEDTTSNITENAEIEMLDFDVPIIEDNNSNLTHVDSYMPELNIDNNATTEFNANIGIVPELNPIPTNFDIGDIGSVPPVDPTGKKEKKKKKNNFLFILIVIILILGVGGLVYYYLHMSKGTIATAVETKNITLNIGDELSEDINYYADFKFISSSNCILDTKGVDITKPGTYEYKISCGNNEYKGTITYEDKDAPIVKTKTIVKKVEEELTAEEFISECKEPSGCTYVFEDSEIISNNLKQVGNYEVSIIVSDANNNSTTINAQLIVIDKDIKAFLSCSLENQTEDSINGKIKYTEKIAIDPNLKYVGIYFKIKEYVFETATEYNEIKEEYITNNNLRINNGVGVPKFDDSTNTIILEEMLNSEIEYGNDYSSIREHLEKNNNYKCKIDSVN